MLKRKLYIRGPFKAEHLDEKKSLGWSIQNISYNGKLFYNLVKSPLIVERLLLGVITCTAVL